MRTQLKARPELRIIIDPVMGDHDHGLYVDPSLMDTCRRNLLPLSDGLTPNGFELAQLTGLPVDDIENVVAAARALLTGRTQWVVVTSAAPDTRARDEMQLVLVTRTQAEIIVHPRINATLKGTGDLFCATLTGYLLNGASLLDAAIQACCHVVRALRHTEQAQCAELLLPAMADSHDSSIVMAHERVSKFTYRIFPCKQTLPI
ncbi:MAG: bifunctional hydroxymethylpyrimidine kinase/phosphomethylpyrimidine kinase [Rhodocyclales bacterium]|nr:bifunctional hydroxymethylpyrimidine kinase/phosphomethylpyrimidine kinase [Rhodocyclales bacterium]